MTRKQKLRKTRRKQTFRKRKYIKKIDKKSRRRKTRKRTMKRNKRGGQSCNVVFDIHKTSEPIEVTPDKNVGVHEGRKGEYKTASVVLGNIGPVSIIPYPPCELYLEQNQIHYKLRVNPVLWGKYFEYMGAKSLKRQSDYWKGVCHDIGMNIRLFVSSGECLRQVDITTDVPNMSGLTLLISCDGTQKAFKLNKEHNTNGGYYMGFETAVHLLPTKTETYFIMGPKTEDLVGPAGPYLTEVNKDLQKKFEKKLEDKYSDFIDEEDEYELSDKEDDDDDDDDDFKDIDEFEDSFELKMCRDLKQDYITNIIDNLGKVRNEYRYFTKETLATLLSDKMKGKVERQKEQMAMCVSPCQQNPRNCEDNCSPKKCTKRLKNDKNAEWCLDKEDGAIKFEKGEEITDDLINELKLNMGAYFVS